MSRIIAAGMVPISGNTSANAMTSASRRTWLADLLGGGQRRIRAEFRKCAGQRRHPLLRVPTTMSPCSCSPRAGADPSGC